MLCIAGNTRIDILRMSSTGRETLDEKVLIFLLFYLIRDITEVLIKFLKDVLCVMNEKSY